MKCHAIFSIFFVFVDFQTLLNNLNLILSNSNKTAQRGFHNPQTPLVYATGDMGVCDMRVCAHNFIIFQN